MKPTIQAILIADKIYTDTSGKKIIAGVFRNYKLFKPIPLPTNPDGKRKGIPSSEFGGHAGCPAAYISITDIHNGTELVAQYVNTKDDSVIFEIKFKVIVTDRLDPVEVVLPLPPPYAMAPEPGVFSLDVLWNGEILGTYRLAAVAGETAEGEQK